MTWRWPAMAALLFALPRIARLLHADVWIEDDYYVAAGALILQGYAPYQDFVLNHLPYLEQALALCFSIFGVSYHVAEWMQAGVIWSTCMLLYGAGRRQLGELGGLCAGLLYATSLLPFTYHVWEREIFTAALTSAALYLYLGRAPLGRKRAIAIGALCALSFSIKLTGLLPAVLFSMHLVLVRRELRDAAMLSAVALVGAAGTMLAALALHGDELWLQVVLAQLIKGDNGLVMRWQFLSMWRDPASLCGVAGLLWLPLRRGFGELWIAALIAVSFPAFFLLSPGTIWVHNLIDALPGASLLGGLSFVELVRWGSNARWPGRLAALSATAALILIVRPWQGLPYDRAVPRDELARAAEILSAELQPGEEVITWCPLVAMEAGAVPVIRFWETEGTTAFARQAIAEHGILAARRAVNQHKLTEIAALHGPRLWLPRVHAAVAEGRARVLVTLRGQYRVPVEIELPGAVLVRRTSRGYFSFWQRP